MPLVRSVGRKRWRNSPWESDAPLRAELFSVERLELHAASLAAEQKIGQRLPRRPSLHSRLKDNETVLLRVYRETARAVAARAPVTPAAEWLLDNYHLVEEQIREIREDLPTGFYLQLPKLGNGPFAGYPRVLGMAWAFVAHTDSRFEADPLRQFLRAYQRIQPLTIGELWAFAITVRIVLIENLRRVAQSSARSRVARGEADEIADQLLGLHGRTAAPNALLQRRDTSGALPTDFAAQLVQRLRDQDPRVTPALLWLEDRLAAQGTTSSDIVGVEHQRQGASNVTVRNIFTSMRLISDVDWAEMFESVSLVDEVLRKSSDFALMDFGTRNLYRSAIEHLARHSPLTELEVATRALIPGPLGAEVASDDVETDEHRRQRDPGYRLIGGGRPAFERDIAFRKSWRRWSSRIYAPMGAGVYIGAILAGGALPLAWILEVLHQHGLAMPIVSLLAVLGVVPAIDASVSLVDQLVARRVGPRMLAGLALRDGVPPQFRTMVVVPILLTTADAVADQIQRLEIHHLSCADGSLHFALLSDWEDADLEQVPGDEALLASAVLGIAALNHMHESPDGGPRFVLLHRRRQWSHTQQRWIGWERKRGKLHELNRLLRGADDTSFIPLDGVAPTVPTGVRFVITLDADTRLPRDAASRLIGKLAHPLNRPRFDAISGRVVEGYAILQPRVTPSLSVGHDSSIFQRVCSSAPGIDPYAAARSDVYQDLFGEGSYTGKGIYDVDAFEAALAGRVRPDSMLSHDLFEGIFARAGLASDVEVVEDFPARYDVAARRQHRWARGDWQLLPWLVGRGDAIALAHRGRGILPLIGRWKMADNLRRSLSAPSSVAALAVGWCLPAPAALAWTGFILATNALQPVLAVLRAVIPGRPGITSRSHFSALGTDAVLAGSRVALAITLLADQAWLMADAIVRSLYRMLVSHQNLLQWVAAAQAPAVAEVDVRTMARQMIGGVVLACFVLIIILGFGAGGRGVGIPIVLLWLCSPFIAAAVSASRPSAGLMPISVADRAALRCIARRTWRFFETFVQASENLLPPDNFQEDPNPVIAHRTSPTNLGLYLLSIVSARDFGWIGVAEAAQRLEQTLATMTRLERHRGHFYNWYDTQDLRPLDPHYVSSVDSGNLAAHLIAVANACRQWQEPSSRGANDLAGVNDALTLAMAAVVALPPIHSSHMNLRHDLDGSLASIKALLTEPTNAATPVGLSAFSATAVDAARALNVDSDGDAQREVLFWTEAVSRAIDSRLRDETLTGAEAEALGQQLSRIQADSTQLADGMDFGFLLNAERRLLAIGYRVNEGSLDPSCYDLLASEARLASFCAIAKGDIPARHWFRLGRPVAPIGAGAALISWSGSMFEYLMPSLVMRAPIGSLLEQTSRLVVKRQISYAAALGIPWGVSESAFNARDLELTYQYSSFGVPGLGLKRGLSQDQVIAPYATGLAAMVDPVAAVRNFERLAESGACGHYGFYEAIDYTNGRLPQGAPSVIVRAYMAHHQGMTIASIANALFDGRLRERFHSQPSIRATELLLQERTSRDVCVAHPRAEEVMTAARPLDSQMIDVRRIKTAHSIVPQTHLLSNGHYALMVTATGAGYSLWRGLAITRWRDDATLEDSGSFIFVRDTVSGQLWSATYQPIGSEPDRFEAAFTEDRAKFTRSDGTLTTTVDVIVSTEDDAEVRRVSIANTGFKTRDVEVTSYSELVLAALASDIAHPAFSKLFVQTEFAAGVGALLATRRRRSPDEPEIWAAHHAVIEGEAEAGAEYETDRARFLGRGRELHLADAIMYGRRLSNTVGTVLDPVFSLRVRLRIPAGATARVAFWTAVGPTRQAVLDLVDKHQEPNAFARAGMLAWTQAQVQLRHMGIGTAEAMLFQRLAGYVLFVDGSMRAPSDTIRRGAGAPAALWSQGISGDVPIVLVRIAEVEDIGLARQLLRAHEYWRRKQLAVDLVILNERAPSYLQDLQANLETALRTSQSRPEIGGIAARGSVFILRSDRMSVQTRAALTSVARVALYAPLGLLDDQLARLIAAFGQTGRPPTRGRAQVPDPPAIEAPPQLEFFNGLGGFSADGTEYVAILGPGQSTPAPWINVVANADFGFHASMEGGGGTWSLNSHDNQLTPWSNDPVTDRPGEVIYVRDDADGTLWGPTASPIRDPVGSYTARHGRGYSRFEHARKGVQLELLQFVALKDPIKISRLTISNTSLQRQQLTVTGYTEWVLGPSRTATAAMIITDIDPATGAMFASNPWNAAFGSRIAFADMGGRQTSCTADRREFLGRNGSLAAPLALVRRTALSDRTGAGLDPCCALQAKVDIEAGGSVDILFLLGQASSAVDASELVSRYRRADLDAAFRAVKDYWDDMLGAVQVKTPDRALDVMLNGWLLYQTLACRIWARSGFYQASGAFGFRDQIQDGMALSTAAPGLTREHLLRAAARQFLAGDVQHWWLPHSGDGVRTRITDDRVWLAYAVCQYLETSGDLAFLDEPVAFIDGPELASGEHDAYFRPAITAELATVYEHAARAIDGALATGPHGLPLIGTGDWNDGMNRVGEQGRGESIWLGWLLHAAVAALAPIATQRRDGERAARWLKATKKIKAALETTGWDGDWYRRAYFDDGAPLGSAESTECRIDSIAQSWSVLSGGGNAEHAVSAMKAVERELLRREAGLVLLFTPPFDQGDSNPGYIRGYPPGVRENGGQYTHAAAWSAIAAAMLGNGDLAVEILAMLNPINHSSSRAAVQRYRVEPYVIAADIYSESPNVGRGGWTWYTGAAGWTYRAGIEWILGFRKRGNTVTVSPCIPQNWPRVEIFFRYHTARYQIVITNPDAVSRGIREARIDGNEIPGNEASFALVDDGETHQVAVVLGAKESRSSRDAATGA